MVIDVPSTNGNNEQDGYRDRKALYKAVLQGNWDSVTYMFQENPTEATEIMESICGLHLAVGSRKANEFVKELVEEMSDVAMFDGNGTTALSIAAAVGNIDAARLLVGKNQDLPNIRAVDGKDRLPVHMAAQYGHRETYEYLFQVTKADVQPSPYENGSGILLLRQLILAGFYDLAANLVEEYPALAKLEGFGLESPLCSMAVMHSAFFSTCELTLSDRLIYSLSSDIGVPLTLSSENVANNSSRGDEENQANNSQAPTCYGAVRQKLVTALWKVIESLVPRVKHIRDMKLMHGQALRLVNLLCVHAMDLDPSNITDANIFKDPFFVAAQHGVSEIVEKIIESFPLAVQFRDNNGHNIFHLAVLNRRHKVFNLISRISLERKLIVVEHLDLKDNSILHLVGNLAPADQLNRVPGAALQMQRELQWFKEVEKVVRNIHQDRENVGKKTPRMVFTEEHKKLAKEGEKWMKDTANSCTVVAALIVTVVFAPAITVPGGTNGHTGFPIFKSKKAFFIFAVSDALSLFSSTTAILMFLSIRTARYAEDDFLQDLPKRLIIGLFTLFISITTMIIAFSSTLYLVFGNDETWILVSVAVSACLLVNLFILLQFPLLKDILCFTYGPGLFGNRREDPLY